MSGSDRIYQPTSALARVMQNVLNIRIQGIDAPETCQEYGAVATQALFELVRNQTVNIERVSRDKYGRVVAKVFLSNGIDVGEWLVANGHAWSNRSRQSLGAYGQYEMAARQAGRGLWAFSFPLEPKVFRKQTKCHK